MVKNGHTETGSNINQLNNLIKLLVLNIVLTVLHRIDFCMSFCDKKFYKPSFYFRSFSPLFSIYVLSKIFQNTLTIFIQVL